MIVDREACSAPSHSCIKIRRFSYLCAETKVFIGHSPPNVATNTNLHVWLEQQQKFELRVFFD